MIYSRSYLKLRSPKDLMKGTFTSNLRGLRLKSTKLMTKVGRKIRKINYTIINKTKKKRDSVNMVSVLKLLFLLLLQFKRTFISNTRVVLAL